MSYVYVSVDCTQEMCRCRFIFLTIDFFVLIRFRNVLTISGISRLRSSVGSQVQSHLSGRTIHWTWENPSGAFTMSAMHSTISKRESVPLESFNISSGTSWINNESRYLIIRAEWTRLVLPHCKSVTPKNIFAEDFRDAKGTKPLATQFVTAVVSTVYQNEISYFKRRWHDVRRLIVRPDSALKTAWNCQSYFIVDIV